MSRKPSLKRAGLLQLISDYGIKKSNGWIYFPAFTSLQLDRYNLNFWDKATITYAEKAGLIETKWNKRSGRLTELGKQLLKESTS